MPKVTQNVNFNLKASTKRYPSQFTLCDLYNHIGGKRQVKGNMEASGGQERRNAALLVARQQLGGRGLRHRRILRVSSAAPADFGAFPASVGSIRRQILLPNFRSLVAVDCRAERSLEPRAPVFQPAFAHRKQLLAAVDEDGGVAVVDASEASTRTISKWTAHRNAVFDAVWTRDDRRIVTASGDLQLRGWDVETQRSVFALSGHSMSVKSVREAPMASCLGAAGVFASGARDGHVMVWDARVAGSSKPVGVLPSVHAAPVATISDPKPSSSQQFLSPPGSSRKRRRNAAAVPTARPPPRSVTCVEFSPDGWQIATAGAVDSVVKFWDVRRLAPSNAIDAGVAAVRKPVLPTQQIDCGSSSGKQRGVSTLAFGDNGASLLVSVLCNAIKLVDARFGGQYSSSTSCHRGPVLLECSGHDASTFYARAAFSPGDDFIVSGSGDGVAYIWDASLHRTHGDSSVHQNEMLPPRRLPILALKGHSSDVNGVAWSPRDFSSVATTSDDGTVRHWHVERKDPDEYLPTPDPPFSLCKSGNSAGWKNWKEFMAQPAGYTYPVISEARFSPELGAVGPSTEAAQPPPQLPTIPVPDGSSPFVIRRSGGMIQQGMHERPRPIGTNVDDRRARVRRRISGALDRSDNSNPSSATSSRQQTTLFDCWQR